MKTKTKENQMARLIDDIGRIYPELKSDLEKLQPPQPGPYKPRDLYPWLLSTSLTILKIVLKLGGFLLQGVIDLYIHGKDRPEDHPVPPQKQRICYCPGCGSQVWHYQGRKRRKKEYHSVFGRINLYRYQASCPGCRAYFYPLDVVLGLGGVKVFPLLQGIALFLGTHLPLRQAAQVLAMTFCLRIAPGTVRDLVRSVGRAFIRRQEQGDWEPELKLIGKAMKGAHGPLILELGLDGVMVPLNKKPKAEPYSHCEARCSTARLKETGGKLLAKLVFCRLTDLSLFLASISSLLDECRESLGIVRIEITGDGARWIWEFAKKEEIPRTVLDWYHLLTYWLALVEAARKGKSSPRRERLERIREALWTGKAQQALEELQRFRAQNSQERKAKRRLVTYIKNNREHMINYGWHRARKRLAGSGATEGAGKHIIGNRLKGSGMRWSIEGADEVMAARCSVINGTSLTDMLNANLAA